MEDPEDKCWTKWFLEAIRKIRSQKQRPSVERICHAIRLKHDFHEEVISEHLQAAVKRGDILKIFNKGQSSYKDPGGQPSKSLLVHRSTDLIKVINKAIRELGERDGSNLKNIEKYIKQSHSVQETEDGDLIAALRLSSKRAVDRGIIIQNGRLFKQPDKVISMCPKKNGSVQPKETAANKTHLSLSVCQACLGAATKNATRKQFDLAFNKCNSCDAVLHTSCTPHELANLLEKGATWTCNQCSLPCFECDLKPDNGSYVVSCSSCSNCFHVKCVSASYVKRNKGYWRCRNCFDVLPDLDHSLKRSSLSISSQKISSTVHSTSKSATLARGKKCCPQVAELEGEKDEDLILPQLLPAGVTQRDVDLFRETRERARQLTCAAKNQSDSICSNTESENCKRNPSAIVFGRYEVQTWYSSPFPQEYARLPKLFFCEFCLKYTKSQAVLDRHLKKCQWRHPPATEIYRCDEISVFEIDGNVNKIYCQNLCLLAKLFLDHKTLYYDVEPFLFYAVTKNDKYGSHLVGYFSKEKHCPSHRYNVSCIMTLPQFQRQGFGKFLIEFSYLLSKVEGSPGTPEKPLSDLGKVSYYSFWKGVLVEYFDRNKYINEIKVQDIVNETGISGHDIVAALYLLGFLKPKQSQKEYGIQGVVAIDCQMILNHITKLNNRTKIILDSDRLRWIPLTANAPSIYQGLEDIDSESLYMKEKNTGITIEKIPKIKIKKKVRVTKLKQNKLTVLVKNAENIERQTGSLLKQKSKVKKNLKHSKLQSDSSRNKSENGSILPTTIKNDQKYKKFVNNATPQSKILTFPLRKQYCNRKTILKAKDIKIQALSSRKMNKLLPFKKQGNGKNKESSQMKKEVKRRPCRETLRIPKARSKSAKLNQKKEKIKKKKAAYNPDNGNETVLNGDNLKNSLSVSKTVPLPSQDCASHSNNYTSEAPRTDQSKSGLSKQLTIPGMFSAQQCENKTSQLVKDNENAIIPKTNVDVTLANEIKNEESMDEKLLSEKNALLQLKEKTEKNLEKSENEILGSEILKVSDSVNHNSPLAGAGVIEEDKNLSNKNLPVSSSILSETVDSVQKIANNLNETEHDIGVSSATNKLENKEDYHLKPPFVKSSSIHKEELQPTIAASSTGVFKLEEKPQEKATLPINDGLNLKHKSENVCESNFGKQAASSDVHENDKTVLDSQCHSKSISNVTATSEAKPTSSNYASYDRGDLHLQNVNIESSKICNINKEEIKQCAPNSRSTSVSVKNQGNTINFSETSVTQVEKNENECHTVLNATIPLSSVSQQNDKPHQIPKISSQNPQEVLTESSHQFQKQLQIVQPNSRVARASDIFHNADNSIQSPLMPERNLLRNQSYLSSSLNRVQGHHHPSSPNHSHSRECERVIEPQILQRTKTHYSSERIHSQENSASSQIINLQPIGGLALNRSQTLQVPYQHGSRNVSPPIALTQMKHGVNRDKFVSPGTHLFSLQNAYASHNRTNRLTAHTPCTAVSKFYMQEPPDIHSHTGTTTVFKRHDNQSLNSSSLSKLQQLTNGLETVGPRPQCSNLTPPPQINHSMVPTQKSRQLSSVPQVPMSYSKNYYNLSSISPPGSTNSVIMANSRSLSSVPVSSIPQGYSNEELCRQSGDSNSACGKTSSRVSSNVAINANFMASQAYGYRAAQANSSYINQTSQLGGFMNQVNQIPVGVMNVAAPYTQDPHQQDPATVYTYHSYISSGLVQPLNGPMRPK